MDNKNAFPRYVCLPLSNIRSFSKVVSLDLEPTIKPEEHNSRVNTASRAQPVVLVKYREKRLYVILTQRRGLCETDFPNRKIIVNLQRLECFRCYWCFVKGLCGLFLLCVVERFWICLNGL